MNQTTLFYVAAGLFFLTAIINFVRDDTAQGATFVALGAAFIAIGSSHRRSRAALTSAGVPIKLPETQQREVEALVEHGNQVEAIERVRDATGAGLREAKVYVDQLGTARTT